MKLKNNLVFKILFFPLVVFIIFLMFVTYTLDYMLAYSDDYVLLFTYIALIIGASLLISYFIVFELKNRSELLLLAFTLLFILVIIYLVVSFLVTSYLYFLMDPWGKLNWLYLEIVRYLKIILFLDFQYLKYIYSQIFTEKGNALYGFFLLIPFIILHYLFILPFIIVKNKILLQKNFQ